MYSAKPLNAEVMVLTCQNRVPIESKGRFSSPMMTHCGKILGKTTLALVETGRVLRREDPCADNHHYAWCRDCRRFTEFRQLTSLDRAS